MALRDLGAKRQARDMGYVWFSAGFFLIHLGAYVVAGVLNQQLVSKDLYGGERALFAPFFRNVDDPAERRRQGRLMVPAQLVRGFQLLAVVPILGNAAVGGLLLTGLGAVVVTYLGLQEFTPVPIPEEADRS